MTVKRGLNKGEQKVVLACEGRAVIRRKGWTEEKVVW